MNHSSGEALRELQVILTADCNLRCSYCYQNAKHGQAMPWPVLQAALDLLLSSDAQPLSVAFTGGEALMEFGLVCRAIEHARQQRSPARKVVYHVVTNGTLLDAATLAVLEKHDARLTVSCDGVRSSQDLRQPGSFDVLDALFDTLTASHARFFRNRVTVSITLVARAVPHLADSVDYFFKKGVGDVVLNVASGQRDWTKATTREFDAQVARIYERSLDHYRKSGLVPVRTFRRSASGGVRTRRPEWGCSAPVGAAFAVDVDGQVYPCPVMAGSYQGFAPPDLEARIRMLSLGDVRDSELPRRIASLRDASRCSGLFDPQHLQHSGDRTCATCRYRSDCFVCPITRVHGPSADTNDVPEHLCAFNRVVAKYRRRFPVEPTREQRFLGFMERVRARDAGHGA